MVTFFDREEVSRELIEVSKIQDVEAGVKQAPLNNLSDAAFELLLWDIFSNLSHSKEYYNQATLMVAGADQGRDVWLTKHGDPVGLVQCKRLTSAFSAPEAIREVIKFILFAELNPELLNRDLPFKYSLAVSTEG